MKNWKLYIWRALEGIAIVITIFITPAALYFQYQSLQEQKILGAWQLITTKAKGNSGKIQALEFLNSKGVPLVGVDLSNAYLSGVNLKGANLQGVNFTNANLNDANFEGADLQGATFDGAWLGDTHFDGAHNLDGTRFVKSVNITADGTEVRWVVLTGANFAGVDLSRVDFSDVSLFQADFTGADLSGAKFFDTSDLETARLDGAFVSKYSPTLPTAPEGYEFVISKTPPKDGKIFIELIKK